MSGIDKRIVAFIKRHHVLTVATSVNNEPWCASCFYAYLEDENSLVFTTSPETRHGKEFLLNRNVSGTIVLETIVIGKIRGLQFSGTAEEPAETLMKKAKIAYLKRFPPAALMDTHLWVIRLNYLKYTDNRLGFGKKLIWEKAGSKG